MQDAWHPTAVVASFFPRRILIRFTPQDKSAGFTGQATLQFDCWQMTRCFAPDRMGQIFIPKEKESQAVSNMVCHLARPPDKLHRPATHPVDARTRTGN